MHSLGARADVADQLEKVEKQLLYLEDKTNLIRHEYLQYKDPNQGARHFESRLNDGQTMMLLKDYVRAAILLYDLVENKENQSQPGYADAVHSLGESLFFNKNYIDARTYFQWLLDDSRGGPYRKMALARLMQIALNTKDFSKVDEAYQRLKRETTLVSPEAEYLWGKTLFSRGRLEEAIRVFSNFKKGEPLYFQSRYFLGVTLIHQGKLAEALAIYDSLTKEVSKRTKERQIIDLARLAEGRVFHDLGQESSALDAYQDVPQDSPNYDQALLEICWTYIQKAEKTSNQKEREADLVQAMRAIEILEVSTPDSTVLPQANLLKGHIQEKLGRFEDATQTFSAVSVTYAEVKNQLDDLVNRQEDPIRYFNEVAGKNLDTFDLSTYLPPLAAKWMSSQEEIASAIGVMKDIEAGKRFVKEARDLLVKLDELLRGSDRINLFPTIRDGANRSLEVENSRLILETTLIRLEEEIVSKHLTDQDRQAMQNARAIREAMQEKLEKLPTSPKQSKAIEKKRRKRIEAMEKAVYELGITIQGMKAQLFAMEEWTRRNESEMKGKEEALNDFRQEIRRGWAMVGELQPEMDRMTQKLETEKSRAGLAIESLVEDQKLRKEYSEQIEKERALMGQIQGRLDPETQAQISRINDFRLRVEKLRGSLAQISSELQGQVEEKAEQLKVSAKQEEQNLDQYDRALQNLESESKNLAGEVAFQALLQIRQKFYQLVLEADVGILDVVWTKKQDRTEKISELGKKRGKENKKLNQEFESVLKEVE